MKNLTGKIVAPIAMLVIGLLGGLVGAFILLTAEGYLLPIQQMSAPAINIRQIHAAPFLSSIIKKLHLQILKMTFMPVSLAEM